MKYTSIYYSPKTEKIGLVSVDKNGELIVEFENEDFDYKWFDEGFIENSFAVGGLEFIGNYKE